MTAPPERPRPAAHPASVVVEGTVDARAWAVDLSITAGQVVAVMGHNGAGKSTLASIVSGMLRLDDGQVRIGETLVDGRAHGSVGGVHPRRILIRPRDRGVALLAQQPQIFEHMSVLANVAYGPRCHRVPRGEARAIARAELAAVDCLDLASRRGDELSGGQAARVALARALAVNPSVLILDEPTAPLDIEATATVQRTLRSRLAEAGTTTILITHDLVDAVSVASWLVVLDHGRVAEQGPPQHLMSRPTSPFTARLAGLNLIRGTLSISHDGLARVPAGGQWLTIEDSHSGRTDMAASPWTPHPGEQVAVIFAPDAIALRRVDPDAPAGLTATIIGAEEQAALVTVSAALEDGQTVRARVTLAEWTTLDLGIGDRVGCHIDQAQLRLLPETTPPA